MKKAAKIIVIIAVLWIISISLILIASIATSSDSIAPEINKQAPWNPKPSKIDGQRIVSLIPSSTELVHAIGAERFLVGVSQYCNYPEDLVSKLPRIGDQNLNIEKIISLKPTIVLDTNNIHKRYADLFKKLGLNYVNINISKQSDLPEAAILLAAHLGDASLGNKFTKSWSKEFKSIKKYSSIKPKVYIEIWHNPIQACGGKNNIDSILACSGGENIFADLEDYPIVNNEMIIEANPDIILLTYPDANIEALKNRPGWNAIKAVKNNSIFCINQDIIIRPSPRNLLAIKEINTIINKVVKNENN